MLFNGRIVLYECSRLINFSMLAKSCHYHLDGQNTGLSCESEGMWAW